MDLINLDDFPPWSIYPLFILAIAGCVVSFAILFRSLRAKAHEQSAGRKSARFSGAALLFLIVSSLAFWFLNTSMFDRFHAMAVEADQVELMYFWPRSPEIIRRVDLVEVKVIPAYRTCGLLVATRENVFRSVNFKKCPVAEEIVAKFSRGARVPERRNRSKEN
jgi:hypothetical protein